MDKKISRVHLILQLSNLLIVGLGNIGIRHAQSALKVNSLKKIFLFDKKKSKVDEFIKKNKNKKFIFVKNLYKLNTKIHVCILSTNSDVRYKILKDLIYKNEIKKFILEKMIFQNPPDYLDIIKIIKLKKIQCWVNFPRRTFTIFKKIKEILKKKNINNLKMTFSGNKWGLISNASHFIDLFCFLIGKNQIEFSFQNVNKKILSSKRKGYYEFNGRLKCFDNKKNILILKDQKIFNKEYVLHIKNKNFSATYYQNRDKDNLIIIKKKEISRYDFIPPLQSDLTYIYLKQILNFNKCSLPKLSRIYKSHFNFAVKLESFIQKNFTFSKNKKILFT